MSRPTISPSWSRQRQDTRLGHRRHEARISTASSAARRRASIRDLIRPYGGDNADPGLVARYEALGKLPQNTFGKALWDFDKKNDYTFPGDPKAPNAGFATPHDFTHAISGYYTSFRGRDPGLDFHRRHAPINPMAAHILPVIFFFHFGEQAERVATPAPAGSTPTSSGTPGRAAGDDGRPLRARLEFRALGREGPRDVRRDWNVTPPGLRRRPLVLPSLPCFCRARASIGRWSAACGWERLALACPCG